MDGFDWVDLAAIMTATAALVTPVIVTYLNTKSRDQRPLTRPSEVVRPVMHPVDDIDALGQTLEHIRANMAHLTVRADDARDADEKQLHLLRSIREDIKTLV